MFSRVPTIIACVVVLLATPASVPIAAQNQFADGDLREIVRVLFEKELTRDPEGKDIEVVLSPRFNSNWIPALSGFKFKRLAYRDERSGVVYYDLVGPERKKSEIVVTLKKGNACVQSGPSYAFRRAQGKWIYRRVGDVQSGTMMGECPGCDLRSGQLYSVLRRTTSIDVSRPPDRVAPTLTGRVLSVECRRIEQPFVECKASVVLTLANQADRPLIVMQPFEDYHFWHGGTALSLTKDDALHNRLVYDTSAWPSINTFPMYQTLANLLDQATPPAKVTRIIEPGGHWEYQTKVNWAIETENHCSDPLGVEIGWHEIRKLTNPMWLRLSFEMWPFNVENFKKNLGIGLRERWKSYGDLYLESRNKDDRYSHWTLTSAPIELDLTKVVVE